MASTNARISPTPLVAGVNRHITLAGRQVHITLRDTDETRLLARLAQLLAQYPYEKPAAQTPAAITQAPAAAETPMCQWHGPMQENTKAAGRFFGPAKMADGTYCKERWPAKGKGRLSRP